MNDELSPLKTVFKAKVRELLEKHPNVWTGADSLSLMRTLLSEKKEKDGTPIKLESLENQFLEALTEPTLDGQVLGVQTLVENHGGDWDATLKKLVRRAVNANIFRLELTKAGYITDRGASGLKDLLD